MFLQSIYDPTHALCDTPFLTYINCNMLRHRVTILRESVAYPGILFGEGSTNSVEDRENGDLGAVAP